MQNVQNSPNPPTMNKNTADRIKKILFRNAMKGEWVVVSKIYRDNPWIHKEKITRSGGTALHIAVSDGREDVEELVNIIKASDGREEIVVEHVEEPVNIIKASDHKTFAPQEVLRMGDETGNTPLHTAAMLGNVKMCRCIAEVDKSLIGARNEDSETPFFMAASHGHKHAFLCLHSLCQVMVGYAYSRRNDGETILHSAISGDYFDLAFQIIHHYEELVNSVNERGLSPLHLLAAKPSAFRSGNHLGRCIGFIYHCIFVDKLKVENSDNYKSLTPNQDGDQSICPANYETCYNLIALLLKGIKIVTLRVTDYTFDNNGKPDAENPPEGANQHEQKAANGTQAQGKNNQTGEEGDDDSNSSKAQGHQLFPPNYSVCFEFVLKPVSMAILVILGLGSNNIRKIREKKQKNTWSIQVMNELLKRASMYGNENDRKNPQQSPPQPENEVESETKPYAIDAGGDVTFSEDAFDKGQSPIPSNSNVSGANQHQQIKAAKGPQEKNQTVLPAKNGITEIVEKILEKFPVAVHDMNYEKKNVVLLAVENRQPHVFELLLKKIKKNKSVLRKVDHEGNSALHLAARLGEVNSWLIPGGAAMLMQWEIKWYEFVMNSVPMDFFVPYNRENKSPKDVFIETHKALVKEGGEWLNKTSESCSVVATLITTVAFAASITVPGGVKGGSGKPTLENQHAFMVFAISSLVAFSFSVTAVIMFLAIIMTRYQERDFRKDLPRKLLVGITSLFVSLASMLISFFAGHFFVLRDKLNYITVVLYVLTCLPIAFFTIGQIPLYFNVVLVTFSKVPRRSYIFTPETSLGALDIP